MYAPGPSKHTDYQSILNSITDGVLTVDRNMIITSFNRAAEKITQVKRSEAIGRHCFEVMRAEVCESGCAIQKTFKTGKPCQNIPVFIVRADNKRIPISVTTGIVRDDKGNAIGGVETFRDLSELNKLRREIYKKHSFEDIVSKNHKMLQLFSILPQVAESHSTVLIEGASGTGKELVARALHHNSARRNKPFVPVNCAAIPETLIESELFGHEKGAFTGASALKQGLLEAVGREEEVEAHRRSEVAQLQVGDEDDAQVDRVDTKGGAQGDDERHHDDDGREDVHDAADQE